MRRRRRGEDKKDKAGGERLNLRLGTRNARHWQRLLLLCIGVRLGPWGCGGFLFPDASGPAIISPQHAPPPILPTPPSVFTSPYNS
jgi:hypothetical protein